MNSKIRTASPEEIEDYCQKMSQTFSRLLFMNNPYNKFLPSVENDLYRKIYDMATLKKPKKAVVRAPPQ
jgi:hypothetical protein